MPRPDKPGRGMFPSACKLADIATDGPDVNFFVLVLALGNRVCLSGRCRHLESESMLVGSNNLTSAENLELTRIVFGVDVDVSPRPLAVLFATHTGKDRHVPVVICFCLLQEHRSRISCLRPLSRDRGICSREQFQRRQAVAPAGPVAGSRVRVSFIWAPTRFSIANGVTAKADAAVFDPAQLDAEQWMRAIQAAAQKYVVLVAKHHDGFLPVAYGTDQLQRENPAPGGTVKATWYGRFQTAAHKFGLKFGVYLSPWDRHEPRYENSAEYDTVLQCGTG